jgi:TonB family protein
MEDSGNKKYNSKAIIGTAMFHGIVLLIFLFFGLTTPLPLPEEEGVVVNLGTTQQGIGTRQPVSATPAAPQPQTSQSTEPTEDIATQSSEESISLPDTPSEEQQTNTQDDTPEPEPQTPEPEPEPEPQVNPNALFPGSDNQSSTSENQGNTTYPGNQGSQEGSEGGSATGGAEGGGIQFSLSGRSANFLPKPEYNSQAQGRVVVKIFVNQNGEVTRAIAGERGTTTTDQTLHRLAEEAARRARFNVKSDAPFEQSGTITYNFIRLN